MGLFDIEVYETTTKLRRYTVDAATEAAAREAALRGDTLCETDLDLGEVTNRDLAHR